MKVFGVLEVFLKSTGKENYAFWNVLFYDLLSLVN